MENDEKKYEDVIKALKGLKKINATENFEADLKRKINSEKFSEKERKGFWENIFVPARLIPSLGLVAAAVIIFFVIDTNSEEMDNPFLIEPRVREDIIAVTDIEFEGLETKKEEAPKEKSIEKDEPVIEKRRDQNELKTSDDKMITGREKSKEVQVPELSDEQHNATKKNVAESFESGGYKATVDSSLSTAIVSPAPMTIDSIITESGLVTGQAISKDELNFRQVQNTVEEQRVLDGLKRQLQSIEKADKHQK
jgi:hypothetical protein